MALNNTTFFTVLGKYIKSVNVFEGLLSTIDTNQTAIEDVLESNSITRLYDNIPTLFTGYKNSVVSWMSQTNALAAEVITDREFVREEIPTQGEDLTSILLALIEYMNDQGTPDTVKESTVTVGSVGDNIASGTYAGDLIVGTTLDGINSPVNGAPASREYRGLTTEMSVPDDTIYCQCISKPDDGQETWQLFSTASKTDAFQIQEEAAGQGPTLRTANTSTGALSVTNGDFELFTTTDEPDGWTTTGTVTTDYGENNTTTYVFRGSSSLQVNTSGTVFKQQITGAVHNKMYMLSLQVGRNAGDPGGSTLDVVMKAENSDGSTEYFTRTQTIAKPTSGDEFVPAYLFFYLDDQYDVNDLYIEITINNFVSVPTVAYLDEVLISAPVYYNGCCFSVVRGKDEFQVGDRFNVDIDNDEAGVIQNYFRKAFKVQLPTATSGSETIADSLAT